LLDDPTSSFTASLLAGLAENGAGGLVSAPAMALAAASNRDSAERSPEAAMPETASMLPAYVRPLTVLLQRAARF